MEEYRRLWEQRFKRLDGYLRAVQGQEKRCSRTPPQGNEQRRGRDA